MSPTNTTTASSKTKIVFSDYTLEVGQFRTETYTLSGDAILIPNANLVDDQLDIRFIQ